MDINIKNESLSVCSGICRTKNNFSTECDVIVPDSKPDIAKVLQLSAYPKITGCETRSGRVIVSGTIKFNILYLADNEEKCVKSITSSCEFSNIVRENAIGESMLTFADIDVSELGCTVANCRKLTLRASLCMNVRVYSCYQLDLICALEGACTKTRTLSSSVICAHAQSSASITDSFELAPGKAEICEVLKADATVTDSEVKVIDDKAIVKGLARISVLYLSESGIEYAQNEMSFAHILEADGIRDDMDIEYCVKLLDVDAYSSENADGKRNVFELSAELFFRVIARRNESIECVTDAFLPHGNLECKYSPVCVDNIETIIKKDADLREKITLPNSMPPIRSIYQVIARPFTESCISENGTLRTSGYTEVYLLYLTDDENSPVYSYKADIDFSVVCESPGCTLTPVADSRLRNISYTIDSDRCVDLRGCVDVSVQCIRTNETDVLYSAAVGEYTPPNRPSIIVSCVCQNRTLWDIAKEYSVAPEKILAANALEDEADISPQGALIIPK